MTSERTSSKGRTPAAPNDPFWKIFKFRQLITINGHFFFLLFSSSRDENEAMLTPNTEDTAIFYNEQRQWARIT